MKKKQSFITFLLTVLMSMLGENVFAHDIAVANSDGKTIYYVWTNNKTELAVSYQGSSYSAYSNEYTGSVVIPSSVVYQGNTYGVTSIGSDAFRNCSGLTSVTIPNSVTSIGGMAFWNCSGLTSVNISDLAAWCNIKFGGDSSNPLYYAHHLYISGKEITNLVIPNSVTSICNYAFQECSGLTSVTIPNSVTSIGQQAFSGCKGLTSVTIGNSVTSIGNSAFNWCSGLTSITIPNSVTSIGGYAFYQCCGLTSVTIGNSVTSIGIGAFQNCSGLTSIKVESGNEKYYSRNNCNAIIETSSNTLIAGCKNTIIPNNVTSIGESAFSGCGLTSVTIPESVRYIGYRAFNGSGLTSITILGSLFLDRGAFVGCHPTAVHISDLESFLNIEYEVNYDENNPLQFADHLYLNGVEIKDLVVPNTITSINEFAFYGFDGLTSVTIPSSVTSIGGCAFSKCSGLTSVTIGNSVTSIGQWAFSGCSGLTSVTIGNSVTSIGRYAFEGCNNLKYICLASDKYPASSSPSLGNTTCQHIMPQSAFDAGIPQDITNYATYTVAPKYITVKSTTATTATLELTPIDLTGGSTGGATPYEVTMYGLNPGSSVKGSWELETKDRGLASIPTVTTKNLVMNVQPAQPTSKIKARLVATVNEPDDDQHFGFEWLRYDAPSIMTPNKVSAPLYKGQIVGSLNNLDPNVYYKYRPYYKSADGSMSYGEWEAFITGDADVFFEPETHTKEASEVTGESAQLVGSWIEGTEDTEEKGFEYWPESGANTRATGENMIRVIVDGNQTTATVDGLMAGKVYGYHSYVKTASGTTYGEDKTFRTPLPGDANDNGAVDAADIVELVNAKAGHPSASFNLKNADANADGSFTEADITATADIIMKQ